MAKNEQQRQKKLAKKRAKELRERRELAQTKQQMASLAGQMQAASRGEVYGCYLSTAENGMGSALIARRVSGGRLAIAFFLLDTYCLGVKDAGGRIGSVSEFEDILEKMQQNEVMQSVSPSTARKAVDAAIEYADTFGFAPHPDYRRVSPIWGDIDPAQSDAEFIFGQNGKPHYIAGPHDDPARQMLIIRRLKETVGEGNYYVTLRFGAGFEALEDPDGSGIARME